MAEVDYLLQREVRDFGSALGTLVEYEISYRSAVVRHLDVHCSYFVLVDFTESDKADTGEEHQDFDKASWLSPDSDQGRENFRFSEISLDASPKSPIHTSPSRPTEGRIRIVRDAGRDAV